MEARQTESMMSRTLLWLTEKKGMRIDVALVDSHPFLLWLTEKKGMRIDEGDVGSAKASETKATPLAPSLVMLACLDRQSVS